MLSAIEEQRLPQLKANALARGNGTTLGLRRIFGASSSSSGGHGERRGISTGPVQEIIGARAQRRAPKNGLDCLLEQLPLLDQGAGRAGEGGGKAFVLPVERDEKDRSTLEPRLTLRADPEDVLPQQTLLPSFGGVRMTSRALRPLSSSWQEEEGEEEASAKHQHQTPREASNSAALLASARKQGRA